MGFGAHGLSAPYTLDLSSKVRSVRLFHQIPHNSKPNMCNLGKRFPCFLLVSHVIQYFLHAEIHFLLCFNDFAIEFWC